MSIPMDIDSVLNQVHNHGFDEAEHQLYGDEVIRGMSVAEAKAELNRIVASERLDELERLIGTYNELFEPNGEFKPFGKLSQKDLSMIYDAIGKRMSNLQAQATSK